MASLTYRGYRFENVSYIEAPTGGWNSDQTPWLLPLNQAHVLDNFIVRLAGPKTAKATLRGAFTRITQWLPSAATVPFGTVPGASLGINFPATIGVAPWDATLAGTSTSLMTPSTTLQYFSSVGTPSAAITVTTTTAPGCRWINFLGSLYGLGYGAASTLTDAGSTYTINANAVLKASLLGGASGVQTQTLTFNLGSSTTGITQSQDASGTVNWSENTGSWVTQQTGGSWVASANTNLLTFSNFGFSVPAGNTILGITVDLTGNGAGVGNSGPVDSQAYISGGTGGTSNHAQFSPRPHQPYGGATDLWGMTWTPTQINASTFSFTTQWTNNTGASHAFLQFIAGVSSLSITVYYQNTAANSAPTALTGAPTGAVDITQYQSRIWLACGRDVPAGGTYHEPTTIFWTNPVTSTNPLTNTAADWQYTDPVSGVTTTNKVVIDNNGSDPVMGFGRVTGAMVIFRRSSVYVLKGTTTANYQITKISGDIGCLDPRSIIETDEGVYFMSLQGLMLTNGSRVTSVSNGVSQALQAALAYQQTVILGGSSNPQTGWISTGITSQGHIGVSVGVIGTSAASSLPMPGDTGITLSPTAMRTIWSGVYDPNTASWYRITSYLFGIDSGLWTPDTFIGVPDVPQIFVSNRLVSQRSLHVVGNAGITMLEDQALNSSYLTSSALYDTFISTSLAGSASPEVGAVQGLGIPARWHSKMAEIVGTSSINRRWGMPTRFFLDHAMAVSGGGTQSYSNIATVASNVTTMTSLSGAHTAWTTGSSGAPAPTKTIASNTVVGWITGLAAAGSSNVLQITPTMQHVPTIPTNSIITGVQVVLYKAHSAGATVNDTVQLYNAGAPIGTTLNGFTWSSTPGFTAYGGPNYLWGTTLTPAIINSGTFGVGIAVNNAGASAATVSTYLANILVYYMPAGGPIGGNVVLSAPSWSVTPFDSDGVPFPLTMSCASSGSSSSVDPRGGPSIVVPTPANTILRESLDFNNEAANLTYDVTLPSIQAYTSVLTGGSVIGPSAALAAFSNVIGELYGIGTEFQTAHDLRSKTS